MIRIRRLASAFKLLKTHLLTFDFICLRIDEDDQCVPFAFLGIVYFSLYQQIMVLNKAGAVILVEPCARVLLVV